MNLIIFGKKKKAIASDSFNRANGAAGATDGAGYPRGGANKTWTQQLGTWQISTNKMLCSALGAGSIGYLTVDAGLLNVAIQAELNRGGLGELGFILRYVDVNNRIRCKHDGVNIVLSKLVGGTPTTLLTVASTFVADAKLKVIANGTAFRVFYNEAQVGGTITIADAALQTSTLYGLYSNNVLHTFDNFSVWNWGLS